MQHRLGCISNLLKIGIEDGLINANPFTSLSIRTPAGTTDEKNYRPFTRPELIEIFKYLKKYQPKGRQMLCWILLCTACRLSDALQIRNFDVKQTTRKTWFIHFVHEPTAQWPVLLKSKAKNNRMTPIHSRLIAEGILEKDRSMQGRLLWDEPRTTANYSTWFKHLLQKLGIWEKKKTVLHSFRGTARDLWREAGISVDVRSALTGHTSKDVGESSYGAGLQLKPDILMRELKKVDLSWLP